jgi:SRSO17 transposase
MDLRWSDAGSEERFSRYLASLSRALGHADRIGPFRSYCTGLLLPGDRKSVEPMAARLRPDRTAAEHQSPGTRRRCCERRARRFCRR